MLLHSNGITEDVWIGLRDSGTGTDFKWISNESTATYVNWNTGQPNRAQAEIGPTDTFCTQLRFSYAFKWNDFPCAEEGRALCMRPCVYNLHVTSSIDQDEIVMIEMHNNTRQIMY